MNGLNQSTPLKWVMTENYDPETVAKLTSETELPSGIIKILLNRNIVTADDIRKFLNPQISDLVDPFELIGMK